MIGDTASRAEATVTFSAAGFAAVMQGDALATARIAGIMAAKRTDLIPLRQAAALSAIAVDFAPSNNTIRITATVSAEAGAGLEALAAVSVAALTLVDMSADQTAVIDGARQTSATARKPRETPHRSAGMREVAVRGQRVKPQLLMGEVTAPRAAPDTRREAFRNFMTSKRLRPTTWAKDAGVSTGEIMGFLTGRSRGFSGEVAEKLARAARVQVEDMFR